MRRRRSVGLGGLLLAVVMERIGMGIWKGGNG